jgi:two-component system OmpR family response regulator
LRASGGGDGETVALACQRYGVVNAAIYGEYPSNTMASILIIDDDPPIRSLLGTLLKRAGHQSWEARNGREALQLLRERNFDICFLDLMMPAVSGFDLLEVLRQERPEKLRCVIVVTAASNRDLQRANLQGAFAILRKPFDLDELLKVVSACLSAPR